MTVEPASTRANRINSDCLDWSYIGVSFAVEHSTRARRAGPRRGTRPAGGPLPAENRGTQAKLSPRAGAVLAYANFEADVRADCSHVLRRNFRAHIRLEMNVH